MARHHISTIPHGVAERGLQAFHAGRFADAIGLWEPLAKDEPRIAAALAETYFRRAMARHTPANQQLSDLQRAVDLAPNDGVYQYHLGLAYHRQGDPATALIAYQLAAQRNPQRPGLALVSALAAVEADPRSDLGALPGLSGREQALAVALAALLRGDTPPGLTPAQPSSWLSGIGDKLGGPDPLAALWQGFVALQQGDDEHARALLAQSAPNLPPITDALRHYYLGAIAARQGQLAVALPEWQQARVRGLETPWLTANLVALHLQQARSALDGGRWSEAAQGARDALQTDPHNPAAIELVLVALDRSAREAADKNDWAAAGRYWGEARTIHAHSGSKTPPRILWHNLAIALEAQEQWEQAGEVWRELLRSKPRGKKAISEYTEAQWEWIRKRTADIFKQADKPAATIEFLKKAVKADPNNISKRLELADALLANDQAIAGRNQLNSAYDIDPRHVPTLIKLAEYHASRDEWYAAEGMIQAAVEQEPQNAELRQRMAQLLQQRALDMHGMGDHAEARRIYTEALTFTPNNPDIELALARLELDGRRVKAAHEHMAKAVAMDPGRSETYAQLITAWAIEHKLDEARQVLAQAEANTRPDVRFYLLSGLAGLQAISRPAMDGFSLFGAPRPPVRQQAPDAWEAFATEMFDRALAQRPDSAETLQAIVAEAVRLSLPKIGLRYAELLRRLAPDDLKGMVLYGLLQRFDEQTDEARKTLQQAARLARQRGDAETERMASGLRREISSPMFSMLFDMGSLFDPEADNFDDEDDLDDGPFDGFLRPPRRRRRR